MYNSLGSQLSEAPVPPTCVREVMTANVVTLAPYPPFHDAVALMANRPFRHLLVTETDGHLAGVLSDRDLLRALGRKSDWSTLTVDKVMTRETETVSAETPLSIAVEKMLAHRINCLPVVDGTGKLAGILTSSDLLWAFQKLQASLERVVN